MEIGICGKPELAAAAKAAGFDYLELPVNGIAAMTEEDYAKAKAAMQAAGLPCPTFNLLFPGSLKLLEKSTTDEEIAAYLEGALNRMRDLGGKIAVFGSGKSRAKPEGMTYGEAWRRLVEVTRLTGEIAAKYGITIVIEPLNRGECNLINSVAEGADLAAAANHPNVSLLADSYHVAKEGEPFTDIIRVSGVSHAHVATKEGRRYPTSADDADTVAFVKALKVSGYTGRISVEGKTDDIAVDGPAAIALLKKLWEDA